MERESSIKKKVRSAVTDVGLAKGVAMSPGVANLFEILDLSAPAEVVAALRSDFEAGKLLYSRLKDAVFESLIATLRPIQARRAELEASGKVDEILTEGGEKARSIAKKTIATVREMAGLR